MTVKRFRCLTKARKSHSTRMLCKNSGDWSKKAPQRMDIAGGRARLPSKISLMARGAAPTARTMVSCEMSMD